MQAGGAHLAVVVQHNVVDHQGGDRREEEGVEPEGRRHLRPRGCSGESQGGGSKQQPAGVRGDSKERCRRRAERRSTVSQESTGDSSRQSGARLALFDSVYRCFENAAERVPSMGPWPFDPL